MTTRFGVTVAMGRYSGDYARGIEHCRFLDEAGFDAIWIGDEQSLRREVYVTMTVAALGTRRIQLNVGPTNPITRHPAVTASAIATLDEVSGGRAALTISTGFSNVANLGLTPAKLSTLKEYVTAVRSLWRNHEAIYRGKTIRLTWATRAPLVYMVAEGPKSLRLAGEIADGVIIGFGHDADSAKLALEYVREGAEASGRQLSDLDIWWHVRWAIAGDHATAVQMRRAALASAAGHVFPYGFEGRNVPEQFHAPIRTICEEYVHRQHGDSNASHVALVDDPALTEYLARRFTIVGTVSEFIEQVQEMASRGLTQIRLGGGGTADERDELLKTVAQNVMPQVR
jgi:5,10-methylenetetrahydromethanopterin reductase